jgi:tetratricopeptide (TPR) repeat protein
MFSLHRLFSAHIHQVKLLVGPILICIGLLLGLSGISMAKSDTDRVEFDELWNYDDPSGTRTKFIELLTSLGDNVHDDYALQLRTQIARTLGLDGQFEQAHAELDKVEKELSPEDSIARIRYLLERGRIFRSSGDVDASEPLFLDAFESGQKIGADYFTIDAAHMVALVKKTRSERIEWSLRGIQIAEQSTDPRSKHWLGSIYNNVGWDYHDAEQYDSALIMFEQALKSRIKEGKERQIEIAQWCVARCHRSLGNFQKALGMQSATFEKQKQENRIGGYVCEELGELYLVLDNRDEAAKYFTLADSLLSQDAWFVENNAERLERIRKLAKDK